MAHELESEEEFDEILEEAGKDKIVVVDFWATWCGPCRIMGPMFDKCAERFKDKLLCIKADVDELSDLAERVEIQVMPTFMFFKNGEKIDEMSGSNSGKLEEMMTKYAAQSK